MRNILNLTIVASCHIICIPPVAVCVCVPNNILRNARFTAPHRTANNTNAMQGETRLVYTRKHYANNSLSIRGKEMQQTTIIAQYKWKYILYGSLQHFSFTPRHFSTITEWKFIPSTPHAVYSAALATAAVFYQK